MTRGRTAAAALLVLATLAGCTSDSGSTGPTSSRATASTPDPVPVRTLSPGRASPLTAGSVPVWTTDRIGLGEPSSVAVDGGTTVVFYEDSSVAAVDTATGRVRWRYRGNYTGDDVHGGSGVTLSPLVGPPGVTDSAVGPVVVVGYQGGPERDRAPGSDLGVAALRLRDGRLVWTSPVGHRDGEQMDVRLRGLSRDGVMVDQTPLGNPPASQTATLRLDAATGRVGWQVRGSLTDVVAGDTAVTGAVVAGTVRLGSGDVGVRSGRDLRTGKVRWTVARDDWGSAFTYAPTSRTMATPSGLRDTGTGRVLVRVPGYLCRSDGRALTACRDDDDRLLTLAGDERTLAGAATPLRPREFEHYDITLVRDGRVWLHDDRSDDSIAVDRTGTTLVRSVPGSVVATSGRFVLSADSDRYRTGRVAVYRI